MILEFKNKPKGEKDKLIGEAYFFVQKAAEMEQDLEIVEYKPKRTLKQNAGYWRICSLLAPCVQEKWGEIIDKEMVSNSAKLAIGYSVNIGKQKTPKSLTKATVEEMNMLIEQLYKMCEFFELKNYELTKEEERAMLDYYNNNIKRNVIV